MNQATCDLDVLASISKSHESRCHRTTLVFTLEQSTDLYCCNNTIVATIVSFSKSVTEGDNTSQAPSIFKVSANLKCFS